jgi:hypothetical protein
VSQFPRVITADITLPWGEPGCVFYLRRGTAIDVVPGSKLEAAIGPGNLAPLPGRGDEACADHSALAN